MFLFVIKKPRFPRGFFAIFNRPDLISLHVFWSAFFDTWRTLAPSAIREL
jgi:hypothetical protein